jgi:hypothetical protein
MYSRGGELRNSGDLTVAGGGSLDTAGSGGDGGEIWFFTDGGESGEPLGNIEVSGNLDISGGTALLAGTGSGGDAGDLDVIIDGAENPGDPLDDSTYNFSNQRVALLGYVSIEANGGEGDDGGEGSGTELCCPIDPHMGIMLRTDALYVPATQKYSVGSVLNEVAINARGGNSVADVLDGGEAGWGGEIQMISSIEPTISTSNSRATNSGDIDVSGGASVGTAGREGGSGGFLYIDSYHGSTNSGDLTANGGTTDDRSGGRGGDLRIHSVTGSANNSGVVAASGADGPQFGGDGGFVYLQGKTANNSAAITLNGANADNPYAPGVSFGGDGGGVTIIGAGLTGSSTNSGAITLTPGTGEIDGDEGCIRVGITFEGDCN